MGGRSVKRELPERESWITEVSDTRLKTYERMLGTPGALYRTDGSERKWRGEYFRDLVGREMNRRRGES
jgi:hypothetical protein